MRADEEGFGGFFFERWVSEIFATFSLTRGSSQTKSLSDNDVFSVA